MLTHDDLHNGPIFSMTTLVPVGLYSSHASNRFTDANTATFNDIIRMTPTKGLLVLPNHRVVHQTTNYR